MDSFRRVKRYLLCLLCIVILTVPFLYSGEQGEGSVVDRLNEVGLYKSRKKKSKVPWTKLNKLQVNKFYEIKKASLESGTFGEQVVLETTSFRVGLPQRFDILSSEEISDMVGKKFCFAGIEDKAHLVTFK